VQEPAEIPLPLFVEGVRVELVGRTVGEWMERFRRSQPRWVYSFLEGQVLHDREGALAGLVEAARRRYETYRTPTEVVDRLLNWWEQIAPKHRNALSHGDELRSGLTAAFVSDIFETLYAVNNRPFPPSSLWLDKLGELSEPPGHMDLVRRWLTSESVGARLNAQIELLDALIHRLSVAASPPRRNP
ncbi:MAG: hypothetical protein ACRDI1_07915, partial [Actinomycetota bacterium]